jgi:hypothetical protein
MKIQLRRVCIFGVGGIDRRRRFEYFTTSDPQGQNGTVTGNKAVLEMVLHPCADCPQSFACPGFDPDHLGQGPYDSLITVADANTDLSDAADTQQLVHVFQFTSGPPVRLRGEMRRTGRLRR